MQNGQSGGKTEPQWDARPKTVFRNAANVVSFRFDHGDRCEHDTYIGAQERLKYLDNLEPETTVFQSVLQTDLKHPKRR